MKKHLKVGLIGFLITFILMMVWASIGMFFEVETPNSPIEFTLQRHWLMAWTIISVLTSFSVMVFATICSVIFVAIKSIRH
jgi:hypothetical protein